MYGHTGKYALRAPGFTLIELLAVLGITSILVTHVTPAFQDLIARQKADSVSMGVYRQLGLARSTASRVNKTLTFCGSHDGRRCTKNNISRFILFDDRDRNGHFDSGERLYQQSDLAARGNTLSLKASLGQNYIEFNGRGGTKQKGSFIYCPRNKNAKHIRKISVSMVGRAYIRRPSEHLPLSC